MSTKTKELRDTLIDAINAVKDGKMDDKQAGAIARLAAQFSNSLQVEINAIKEMRAQGLTMDSDLLVAKVPTTVHLLNTVEDDKFDAGGRTPVAMPSPPADAGKPRAVKGSRY